ncbi:MAG TPA: NAD(P)/FAD-dependent oxidoreductase [Candidatus Methylomirabilis sp.]|nr:NAD(P)/FAD-dependent oxidoreductase [Candidatus Methylomirabilis sp.]
MSASEAQPSADGRPRVIVVGGGFAGLTAVKALRDSAARILLIDRRNHHVFQPLLYQVATALLPSGDVGAPIREVLRHQPNTVVAMAEATGVDPERRHLVAWHPDRGEGPIPYDYLVLATGVEQSYFGHDEFAPFAPGLKSLEDAQAVRSKLLRAYETAETEEDPSKHRDLLTVVLVGAGPTGVELAAAIASMARVTLKSNFRRIDPSATRIILLDNGPRILAGFAETLSRTAHERLTKLGVEVRTHAHVDDVDEQGVVVAGERIASRTVLWTAGVRPSPAGQWLKADTDRAGRVAVGPDLSVPRSPEVFVVGDTAHLEQDGKSLPGVAQVAMQQGRYVGRLIANRLAGRPAPPPFRYSDRGNMAVIGRGFAILESGKVRLSGFPAWAAWASIHLAYLPQARNRPEVLIRWLRSYVTGELDSRVILGGLHPPYEKRPEAAAAKASTAAPTGRQG